MVGVTKCRATGQLGVLSSAVEHEIAYRCYRNLQYQRPRSCGHRFDSGSTLLFGASRM